MSDSGFEAARQRKIEEIRRTGKTWQWPDPVQRPARPGRAVSVRGWRLLAVAFAALAIAVWWRHMPVLAQSLALALVAGLCLTMAGHARHLLEIRANLAELKDYLQEIRNSER